MLNKLKKIFALLNALALLLSAKATLALTTQQAGQTPARGRLENISGAAGYSNTGTPTQQIIVSIILYAMGLVGLIFLILMLLAGFQWMTAGGNEDKITKAKDRFKNAVIGFAIVMLAYSITVLLTKMLGQSTVQTFYGWGQGN
jgi:hypothetical protein